MLLTNIIRVFKLRRMKEAGYVARMGYRRGAYRVLVERLDEKRPLGRPWRIWKDNNKMDLQKVRWGRGLD